MHIVLRFRAWPLFRAALAFLLAAGSGPAFAQSSGPADSIHLAPQPAASGIPVPQAPPGFPMPVSQPSGPVTAEKTTAAASRMIAMTGRLGSIGDTIRMYDSSSYSYSGHRSTGSHDTQTYYLWQAATGWTPTYRYLNTYDVNNHRSTAIDQQMQNGAWLSKTRNRYFPDAAGTDTLRLTDTFNKASGTFWPSASYRYQVNANNDPLSATYAYWNKDSVAYLPSSRFTYNYDAAGNLLTYLFEVRTGNILIASSRQIYTYTAANKRLSALVQTYKSGNWNTTDSINYSYDAVDNLINKIADEYLNGLLNRSTFTGYSYNLANQAIAQTDSQWTRSKNAWSKLSQQFYSYDAAGLQTGYVYRTGSDSIWRNVDSVSMSYNSAGLIVQRIAYTADSAGWQPGGRDTYTYTPGMKFSSLLSEQYSRVTASFGNRLRQMYTYNSFDQITRAIIELWAKGAWTYTLGASDSRYYYEIYNDGVGVGRAPARGTADIMLYPVPAGESVTLSIRFSKPQPFCAAISDIGGRVLMQWTGTGDGLYNRSIQTSALVSGLYYISVQTEAGRATRSFLVQH